MVMLIIYLQNKTQAAEKIKAKLEEFMGTDYDFDAVMDIGNGWEPYEGCMLSLLMILEDQDTGIEVINEGSEAINESCVFSIKHYFITLV